MIVKVPDALSSFSGVYFLLDAEEVVGTDKTFEGRLLLNSLTSSSINMSRLSSTICNCGRHSKDPYILISAAFFP